MVGALGRTFSHVRASLQTPMFQKPSFGLSSLRFFSSGSEAIVSDGSKVTLHYTGTFEDGNQFDSSVGNQPLVFRVGSGQVISGFDSNVRGMAAGEKKKFTLSPEEGYGPVDPDAVLTVPLNKLPEGAEAGMRLETSSGMVAVIESIDGATAKVNTNHPLAGKSLTFEIEVLACTAPGKVTIETIKEGDNATFPKTGDKLTMHYTGTLADSGTQFDCSRTRGQAFQFTIGVGQVIEGWDTGVMSLSLGQRAKLMIPSDMGYGERGAGADIPPNADLIFDVEVLKIESSAK